MPSLSQFLRRLRRRRRTDLISDPVSCQIHEIALHPRPSSTSLHNVEASIPTVDWALKACTCPECEPNQPLWFANFATPDDAIEEALSRHVGSVKCLAESEQQYQSSVEYYKLSTKQVLQLAGYFRHTDMPTAYTHLRTRLASGE
jgi:hypothetical protein